MASVPNSGGSKRERREARLTKEQLDATHEAEGVTFLKERSIQPGSTKPDRSEKGTLSESNKILIRTNAFNVQVPKPRKVCQYRVEIVGDCPMSDGIEPVLFNDDTIASFHRVERRKLCMKLFNFLVHHRPALFPPREQLYYDTQSTLYSLEKGNIPESAIIKFEDILADIRAEAQQNGVVFDEAAEAVEKASFRFAVTFTIKFTYIGDELTTDLAKMMVEGLDDQQLEIVRFMNVSSSQYMYLNPQEFINFPNGISYFSNGAPPGFNAQVNQALPGRVYLAAGVKKSARVIGDQKSISFVVSPKISMFYIVGTALQIYEELVANSENLAPFEKAVRGLYFFPIHLLQRQGNSRYSIMKIHGVRAANQATFDFNGRNTSVADYYAQKYAPLRRPDLPVIVYRQGRGENERISMFPLEVCEIVDNQRVGTNAMSGDLTARMIREACALPDILQPRIMSCFRQLNTQNSPFLRSAGIEVAQMPIDLDVPVLSAPSMMYGRNLMSNFDPMRGNWRTGQYLLPSGANCWALYSAVRVVRNVRVQFTEQDLQQFSGVYQQAANQKGVVLPNPADCRDLQLGFVDNSEGVEVKLRDCFKNAAEHGCQFIMLITNKADVPIHASMKAFEQEFGVVTQNVTTQVALAAAGIRTEQKRLTMENIVNKTNVKLDGLNYIVGQGNVALGEGDLFVGFGVNLVGGGFGSSADEERENGPPTVLGYAANDSSTNSISFTGDYVYHQNTVPGGLAAIERAMTKVCERYKKNHGAPPKRVFVYRSGCSDSQFASVMLVEIPLVRHIIKTQLDQSVELVFLVVTKAHSMTFTPVRINPGKAKDQNVPHGLLVNHGVTSRLYDEFYLSGSRALQGTTKVPRYAVLCNEAKISLADIQKISYHLCYAFQIIPQPVSLPSPVAIALEYAKRGRNLYNADVNIEKVGLATGDIERLNVALTYDQSEKRGQRVNA